MRRCAADPANVNILLVEDDNVDVMAFERALERQKIGNLIYRACDGIEGLEILRGENGRLKIPQPYIILLDLSMPRMNGLKFLDEIRNDPELHRSIVFVLTTSHDVKDMCAAYEHNIAGYLLKSEVGDNFLKVVQMIDRFTIAVQFPPMS